MISHSDSVQKKCSILFYDSKKREYSNEDSGFIFSNIFNNFVSDGSNLLHVALDHISNLEELWLWLLECSHSWRSSSEDDVSWVESGEPGDPGDDITDIEHELRGAGVLDAELLTLEYS